MRNLLNGGYVNPIMPVNPNYEAVAGVVAYPDVASLPKVPDLAVIATPAPTVPRLVPGVVPSRTAVSTSEPSSPPGDSFTSPKSRIFT